MPTRTKADDVFARLRDDILAGALPPGRRLRYIELCKRYGASMGVLRESLVRLAEQGLVVGKQQQGFEVIPLSADHLRDLSEAREDIEGLVLRRAIADGGEAWEARLLSAHDRLRQSPIAPAPVDDALESGSSRRISGEWIAAHSCFHHVLLDGCVNERLKAIASTMRDASEVYRNWAYALGHDEHRDVEAEHAAILTATIERDPDLAVALLRAHIRRTTTTLLAVLGE